MPAVLTFSELVLWQPPTSATPAATPTNKLVFNVMREIIGARAPARQSGGGWGNEILGAASASRYLMSASAPTSTG
jgi:hypothetical protein